MTTAMRLASYRSFGRRPRRSVALLAAAATATVLFGGLSGCGVLGDSEPDGSGAAVTNGTGRSGAGVGVGASGAG